MSGRIKNVRDLIEPSLKKKSFIVISKHETNSEAMSYDPGFWGQVKKRFNIEGSKHHTVIENEKMRRTALGENPAKHNQILQGLKKMNPKAKIGYEKDTSAYTIDFT